MPARAYRASGLSHPGAIYRLALICLVAGIAAGLVEGYISRWLNVLLVFPGLLGLVIGVTATQRVDRLHIRAPLLVAILAGSAGLVGQAAVVGTQYYQFRVEMRSQFGDNPGIANMADRVVDAAIEQETGHGGFAGYLLIRASSGTQIKRGGESSGLTLSGPWFWGLFGLNFLIAAGIAAQMGFSEARKPYCEACQNWYDRTDNIARGSVEKGAITATLSAIERGAFNEVPGLLGKSHPAGASTLQLLRCSKCSGHEPQLTYVVIDGIGKKQKTTKPLVTMLRPEDAKSLLSALEKKS